MTVPTSTGPPDPHRDIGSRFRAVLDQLEPIPLPGHGATWKRFERLAGVAEEDLALARLVEGHADALAILEESGMSPVDPAASYGVWAARSSSAELTATPVPGGWRLDGKKAFCSGSGLVRRSLVTAEAPDGYRLFDVATSDVVIATVPDSWPAVGMADSISETLVFGGAVLPDGCAVGPPGFYTDRPGFWFGACGVASCWYGGARGLVQGVLSRLGPEADDLVLSEVGRQSAGLWAMRSVLAEVASAIDGDPLDGSGGARARALALRLAVHDGCQALLTSTAAVGGARSLCHDRRQAQRAADLPVYLAQHHAGPDAVQLGSFAIEGREWS
jgi:alkylation response protein AidB-like acyl-CoA dehydrogenase